MAPNEYSKALDKALSDLNLRVQQRDLLKAEIAGLRETVRVLATLLEISAEKQQEIAKLLADADYATPSLTDAIRTLLLRVSPKEMTAIEVRNALEDSSDFEDCSLSACHAALKRMLSEGEIEAGTAKNGKASYRRVIRIARPNASFGTLSALAGLNRRFDGPIDPEKRPDYVRGVAHPVDKISNRGRKRNTRFFGESDSD